MKYVKLIFFLFVIALLVLSCSNIDNNGENGNNGNNGLHPCTVLTCDICNPICRLDPCTCDRPDCTPIPSTWETGTLPSGFTRPNPVVVFPITRPAAGNFPNALYNYPFRIGNNVWLQYWIFTQTIDWRPQVTRVFETNTKYTAILTLDPVDGQIPETTGLIGENTDATRRSFRGTLQSQITGLPTNGVESISAEIRGESLVIYITFEKTESENVPAQMLFEDTFSGNTLDLTKWSHPTEWNRQGRSSWRNDMVSISSAPPAEATGGSALRIGFKRDPVLGEAQAPQGSADRERNVANWVRAGAVQTQRANSGRIFSNTFGYWEARIRFPAVQGTWGAFWLMSNTIGGRTSSGVHGTEIDIIESIGASHGDFNFALHWNYHDPNPAPSAERSVAEAFRIGRDPVPNIYDGQFHIFAVCWSPEYYVFYINNIELWRVRNDGQGLPTGVNNFGVMRNPSYMILSVEAGNWGPVAGVLPPGWQEDAVYVDWVRVWNQPRN